MDHATVVSEIVPHQSTGIMPIYCAWCGGRIGARMSSASNDPSHGICRNCMHRLLKDIQAATKEKED